MYKKNKTDLTESLDIVLEATEHARKYPSVAEDKDTNKRFVQYVMTRILNQLNSLQEIPDTMAAAALLGLNVGLCSEIFTVYDAQSYIHFALDEKNLHLPSDNDTSNWSSMDINSDLQSENESCSDSDSTMESLEDSTNSSNDEDIHIQYYNSAYGSCPLNKVDEGARLVAIPYPMLYRFRGERLKLLNRIEYCSCVRVVRDRLEDETPNNDPPPTY